MSRSRIWWISTAAVLCTAVPALAYSWPALFGVPGAFGQEASRPAQMAATPARAAYTNTRPVAVAATSSHSEPGAEACADNTHCPLVGDCLSAWQRLWERGEYARALGLAHSALQAAPRSLAARHAVAVSQIMNDVRQANDLRQARPEGSFEEAEACQARCPSAQPGSCPLPLSVLLPSVQMPLLPVGAQVCPAQVCPAQVCPEARQPLFIRHFESPCGNNVRFVESAVYECPPEEAKGCCAKCAKDCKCCCTKADKTKSRTASAPMTILIVREPVHVPVQVPAPHVVPLPPPPVMSPVFSYAPAFPSMPASPAVGRPAVAQNVYQVVGEEYTVPPSPECADGTPGTHVRILQRGGMCFVSSPNFEIRCDRVHSNDGGRLVLEGNVTLVSRRHGQTMTIEAERVTLNVNTDQFQIDNARGLEQTRFNVAPVTVPATATGLPVSHYGASPSGECNVRVEDPKASQLRELMEMRKAARQAYELALEARVKELEAGKTASSDFLLDAIARFQRAVNREREIIEQYETHREGSRAGTFRFDGPGSR